MIFRIIQEQISGLYKKNSIFRKFYKKYILFFQNPYISIPGENQWSENPGVQLQMNSNNMFSVLNLIKYLKLGRHLIKTHAKVDDIKNSYCTSLK